LFSLLVLTGLLQQILGDVYMHNPRGSNDRNCERNVNRDNENRLFDSQNNNNGGYACQRAVGGADMQNEMGIHTYTMTLPTGQTYSFNQSMRMYYYEGSVLPIEWTNQHGCGGNAKVACEIVFQYACEDTLDPQVDDFWPWVQNKAEVGTTYRGKQHFRDMSSTPSNIAAPRDGVPTDSNDAATDTITDTEAAAIPNTAATQRFGMHESFDYYTLCQQTQRNMGLYTSDQLVRRTDRRGTRQNPNGNRHGFECPEERDYYPWWAPSPWVDVAVLTDSGGSEMCYPTNVASCTKRCQYYMNNTFNFNKKGYCDVTHAAGAGGSVQNKLTSPAWTNNVWYNNPTACAANGFTWYEISHSDNLNLPPNNFVCGKTAFSRVNQLGNARNDDIVSQSALASMGVTETHVPTGVNANRFMWTVPTIPSAKSPTYFPSMTSAYQSCVLRMRYNISTADFQQWPIDAVDPGTSPMVDHRNNSKSETDVNTPIHQNPYVYVSPGASESTGPMFLSLKVNTNQYGRTFQDRSYVFSIKPKPSSSSPANNFHDVPAVNVQAMSQALNAGGKIYNVNVRGKRGNIVQVYPSVEYDFTPNALALGTNDMIHFQWTGSDYNPRRGCNDATGGPPDANTFNTDANANQNSRADRSNVVFTNHMAQNVPKDYLGYDHTDASINYTAAYSMHKATVLSNAPCYNPQTDNQATADECFQTIMRLAYLNQQEDGGSLFLRQSAQCLTQTQLDNYNDQDTARSTPLNCAKMNAKPFPYFDGGIMHINKAGWFSYYSSRNNNFSNRMNSGVICVGPGCKLMNGTGVLQENNPAVNGNALSRAAASKCVDTANAGSGSNANGATSCLTTATNPATAVLKVATYTRAEADNDAKGSGNPVGCAVLTYTDSGVTTVEQKVALAIGLLFVGLFCAWLAYYLYNRYQARQELLGKYRYDVAWQTADAAAVASSAPPSKAIELVPAAPTSPYSSGARALRQTGSSGPAVSPPTSPKNSGRVPGRLPSAGPTLPSSSGSSVSPRSGRVLSTKRARSRHEEMI